MVCLRILCKRVSLLCITFFPSLALSLFLSLLTLSLSNRKQRNDDEDKIRGSQSKGNQEERKAVEISFPHDSDEYHNET